MNNQEDGEYILMQSVFLIVANTGWTRSTLEDASIASDHFDGKNAGALLFPNGNQGMINYMESHFDSLMMNKYIAEDIGITMSISKMIMLRFALYNDYKSAIARNFSYLSLPSNLSLMQKLIFRTIDIIWAHADKDKSTDYNYYSKRILLESIYVPTLIYWLSDDSDDSADTRNLLNKKLNSLVDRFKSIRKIKGRLF